MEATNYFLKQRNINIDIIKCLAVFFVISVHFFLNNNFYSTTITCPRMYIMIAMRTFFMMCVPLFVLITGYLMNKKEFSVKYYTGIKKIIFPYTIISIITLLAKIFLAKYGIFESDKLNHYINDFIDFKLIGYAWYVDMYLGLFLLIPFINKMFIGNKVHDRILILTLSFLTVLPSISSNPTLIISKWTQLWIFTYYMIGAYISRYKIKISLKKLILLFVFVLITFIFVNIFSTHGSTWGVHNLDSWGGIENTLTSTLFFIIMLKIDFSYLSDKIKNCISNIAKLSLGIYLSSYLFDKIIYYYFNQMITNTTAKLEWYVLIVPCVFIFSLILAKITDNIIKIIDIKIMRKN